MTALDGRWLANEGLGAGAIAGVIGLAGPYDFYPFTSEGSRNSFGHVADAGTTQPVNFAYNGAPPMLLLHGETDTTRSEEHTSELQSLMRTSYDVFCLKTKNYTSMKPTIKNKNNT